MADPKGTPKPQTSAPALLLTQLGVEPPAPTIVPLRMIMGVGL